MKQTHIIAIVLAITAFFLWSTLGIFFNFVSLPTSVYVVFGSLVGLAVLYVYFFAKHNGLPKVTFSGSLIGLFLVAAIKGVIWFRALALYPIAKAMLIHNLAPIVALGAAPILIREKPNINHIIAVITGFLGLMLLLRFNGSPHIELELGAVFSMGAALCSGLQDVFQRKLSRTTSGAVQAFVFILGQAVGSIFFLTPTLPHIITWMDFGSILFFGVVGTALPIILLSHAFSGLKSFEVATVGYTEPALGAIWGALFLKQSISPTTALGGLLIFLSGLTAIKEEIKQ